MKFPLCHCVNIYMLHEYTYKQILNKLLSDGYVDKYPDEDWRQYTYLGVNSHGDIMRYNLSEFYFEISGDNDLSGISVSESNVIPWQDYLSDLV